MGPEPTPPIYHFHQCEDRGSLVLRTLLTLRNLVCQPPKGLCTSSPRRPPLATLYPVPLPPMGNLGAPYPFLATFRCLSSVLSPSALTPAARSWWCFHYFCRKHSASLEPASCEVHPPVEALPPDVSDPCCWQMAHNPGSFLGFNRTLDGKRQSPAPGAVVCQQGQDLWQTISIAFRQYASGGHATLMVVIW